MDYKNKDVDIYYVYSNIQHFETNGIVTPYSIEEKLLHIAEAKRRTGSSIPWICDTMDNQMKQTFRATPNAEIVLDPNGKIVRKRYWSNPTTLRKDLTALVGPVAKPTEVADIDVRFQNESREIASGVVPKIKLPKHLKPLVVEAKDTDNGAPFFVKLRAEAEFKLLTEHRGQLYLAFHVDPLHKVHWNNKAGKFQVEIESGKNVKVSDLHLDGPVVKDHADIDAREFLVDVEVKGNPQPIQVTAHFTVCDDAETFCLSTKQSFEVSLKRDEYGGTRPGIFLKSLFADVEKMDKNQDGCLTKDELPAGKVTLYVGHMDKNEDGKIDAEEISEFKAMFGNGKGFQK